MRDQERRIRSLVEALCAPECAGRAPGTPGGRRARDLIAASFGELGLTPGGPDGSYLQPVPACGGHNVVGRHGPGGRRAILVAAHYDHLGPADGGECFWGADDNAAAVAILLEVARALQGEALERDVWFVSFDGEEPPYFLGVGMGSIHFVQHPPFDLGLLDMMVCMDLMGHALGPAGLPPELRASFFVLGGGRSAGTVELLDGLATSEPGVFPRRLSCEVIPALSDYYAFDKAGIPHLFLTCGRWEHYHQVTDTPEKLDYPKIAGCARWLTGLVRALCARPEPARYVPEGTDDAGTVQSLSAVAEVLAPFDPRAATLRALLAPYAGREAFSVEEKQQLSALVSMVEAALS
ncbi:MAG: M28 family peptidase [Planctomycetota bacterium]